MVLKKLLTSSLAIAALAAGPALAQDFPSDDITLIVPFAPGGAVDTTSRIIAEAANRKGLAGDYEIVVENISNSVVGQTTVARANPDGLTVLAMTSSIVTNPKVQGAPFEVSDFQAVALYTIDPSTIAVPANSEFETIEEFIAAARDGEVSAVTSGVGTSHHMSGLALQDRGNINLNIINISAFGEQVQQIAGGHVQAALWPWGEAKKQVEAGTVRILSVAGRERLPELPDVPTWEEAGLDIVEFATFRGWGVPVDTPSEKVDFLANILYELSKDEEYVARMDDIGSPVEYAGPEGFQAVIDNFDVLTTEILAEAEN